MRIAMTPLWKYLEEPDTVIEKKTTDLTEKKLGDLIKPPTLHDVDIAIIGIPFDQGVKYSKGRVGARKAPDAIREELTKYGTTYNIDYQIDISSLKITDLGNIKVDNNDPETSYESIRKVIYELFTHDIIPLVLGGGHDITFPCVAAMAQYFLTIGGINIDVHFDVREQNDSSISSGMAFRKLLEDLEGQPLQGKYFAEVGADGTVNAKKYVDYLQQKHALIYPLKTIRDKIARYPQGIETILQEILSKTFNGTNAVFASLDIDSVSFEAAPGCSFTNPNGFTTDEISRIAHAVGFHEGVKYFDIAEVNPEYDIDNRTSRLCARIISCFLTGFKQRKQCHQLRI